MPFNTFDTNYLCEKGFDALKAIEIKYCNKLNAKPDLCLKLIAVIVVLPLYRLACLTAMVSALCTYRLSLFK